MCWEDEVISAWLRYLPYHSCMHGDTHVHYSVSVCERIMPSYMVQHDIHLYGAECGDSINDLHDLLFPISRQVTGSQDSSCLGGDL